MRVNILDITSRAAEINTNMDAIPRIGERVFTRSPNGYYFDGEITKIVWTFGNDSVMDYSTAYVDIYVTPKFTN